MSIYLFITSYVVLVIVLILASGSAIMTKLTDIKNKLDTLTKPQKQKWSEEDVIHLTNAILAAEKEWGINSNTTKWLKSLRP